MSQAKDRMCRRVEKVLLTMEALLIAAFCGVCVSFFWSNAAGASIALWVFAFVYARKRYLIHKERLYG